jgi:hypothetical protein
VTTKLIAMMREEWHRAPQQPLPMAGDVERRLRARTALRVEQVEGRRLLTAFARAAWHRLWVWCRPRGGDRFDLVALTSTPPSG